MLTTSAETTWAEAMVVLAGLLGAGFLVSWISTEVLHLSRHAYVAVLAVVTAVAAVVVAEVAGASLAEFIAHHWALGLAGALVTGLGTGAAMRRKEPGTEHLDADELRVAAVWEGVIYGIAEGVLLSVLPVFIVWQAAADAGWNNPAAWAAGLFASVVMIAVHHFGYWDFRGPKVGLAIVGCGVLTLGYLVTGSLLAAALGHVLLHIVGITAGIQLPPHAGVSAAGA